MKESWRAESVTKMIDLRSIRRKLAPYKRQWLHSARKPLVENNAASQTVVLASSGRSGSTWITRTVNWNNEFRIMFEPFHGRWVREFRTHERYQYVDPNNVTPAIKSAISSVIEGRITDPWIDQYNRKRDVSKRMIKAIRANLFLPAIRSWHPETKLVLVVRNPFAQANSAVEGNWNVAGSSFLAQSTLMERYPGLAGIILRTPPSPFLQSVLGWCIVHFVPFMEINSGDIIVIFYEDLFTKSEQTFRGLFKSIGEPFNESALEAMEEPSRTTRHAGTISQNDPLNRWRKNVSKTEFQQASEILKSFGLYSIYGDGEVPAISSESCFQAVKEAKFI